MLEGSFGILRSPGWRGNTIVFEGDMTMIGLNCVLRQTWKKTSDDEFSFVNEEKLADGSWGHVDEWDLKRKPRYLRDAAKRLAIGSQEKCCVKAARERAASSER